MQSSILQRNKVTIYVKNLILSETDEMPDQYQRSFQINNTEGTSRELHEIIETNPVITQQDLAWMENPMVTLSAENRGIAYIPNGWNTKRFRFVMWVEIEDNLYSSMEIITGFTDTNDYVNMHTRGVDLPSDMIFYINRIFSCGGKQNKNTGIYTPQMIVGSSSVISALNDNTHPQYLATPQALSSHLVLNSTQELNGIGGPIHHTDAYITPNRLFLSNTSNNSLISFADRSLNVPLKTYKRMLTDTENPVSADDFTDWDNVNFYTQVRKGLEDSDVNQYQFLKILGRNYGNHRASRSYFSWFELKDLDPTVTQRFELIARKGVPTLGKLGYQVNESEIASDSTLETILSQTILNEVPTYMIRHGLLSLGFTYTSLERYRHGNHLDDIVNIHGFEPAFNRDNNNFILALQDSITEYVKTTLIPQISRGGAYDVKASIACDIFGYTQMLITIAGGSQRQYSYPTYASSIFTPLTTDSSKAIKTMAESYSDVVSNLQYSYGRLLKGVGSSNSPHFIYQETTYPQVERQDYVYQPNNIQSTHAYDNFSLQPNRARDSEDKGLDGLY